MDYGPRAKPKQNLGMYRPPNMLAQRPRGGFGGPAAVIMKTLQALMNNQPNSPYQAGRQVGQALKRR